MGTSSPPNRDGTACTLCWGAGLPFAGATPTWILADVSGVLPGSNYDVYEGLDPNGKWLLRQTDACSWRLILNGTIAFLNYSATFTDFYIRDGNGARAFDISPLTPTCSIVLPNLYTVPDLTITYNGKCVISWNLKGLTP